MVSFISFPENSSNVFAVIWRRNSEFYLCKELHGMQAVPRSIPASGTFFRDEDDDDDDDDDEEDDDDDD